MDVSKYNFFSNKALHKMLADSASCGRLCHAYLFFGEKGVGKRTIAEFLAAAALCKGENKPCGVCPSCKKLASSNHPDLYIYDGKDQKNSIHIETIRTIRQEAYVLPNDGEKKVYIIPNCDNMTIGAANALLKVLEEPPLHAMFILTANSKAQVPETILSRCLQIEVFPMSDKELAEALSAICPEKAEEIPSVVQKANGNIGRALDMLGNEKSSEINMIVNEIFSAITKRNEYNLLKALSALSKEKDVFRETLYILSGMFRSALLQKTKQSARTPEFSDFLMRYSSEKIIAMIESLEEILNNLDKNANMNLSVNKLCSDIMSA